MAMVFLLWGYLEGIFKSNQNNINNTNYLIDLFDPLHAGFFLPFAS